MAAPFTPEWLADWRKLPTSSQNALECMFDGPIPHQAILDELRAVEVNARAVAPQINNLIKDILAAHGMPVGHAAE